jgi:hypothetical protein
MKQHQNLHHSTLVPSQVPEECDHRSESYVGASSVQGTPPLLAETAGRLDDREAHALEPEDTSCKSSFHNNQDKWIATPDSEIYLFAKRARTRLLEACGRTRLSRSGIVNVIGNDLSQATIWRAQ